MPSQPKKTSLPGSGRIQKTPLETPKGLSFSMKYFENTHDTFNIEGQDISYLGAFLVRLRAISSLTSLELRSDGSKALRCHPIEWSKTSQPHGFGLPGEEQLVEKPYQFSISTNKHGRVHGFFIGEVFYVVWLDPNHKLYPG
jgi:hypothetical protein